MEPNKYRSRDYAMSSSKRLPFALLLLLAIGAATLSIGILHKMRERRILALLLQESDKQLISIQILLEKEKAFNEEMRGKVEELKAKTSALRIQRAELTNKLMESETTTTYLKNTQRELEAALKEKESHINQMKEKAADSSSDQMVGLMELLQQKEAELEEMKARFRYYNKAEGKGISNASIMMGTNNKNATSDIVVLEKLANSSDAIPAPAEEKTSFNATTTESNHQDSSSEEQWVKFTTNAEDEGLEEKTSDENTNSDDAPEEDHSAKPELPQQNKKLADSQRVSEELDGTGQLEESQDQVSYNSRDSKLLEKEDSEAAVRETGKKINPKGDLEISKDSLSEANQDKARSVATVVDTIDVKPNQFTNDAEQKKLSNRQRRRKSRSERKKMAKVAASDVDREVIKEREVDATENP